MSGSTSASHCSTRGMRTFNELTFHVANRITRRPPSSQPGGVDAAVASRRSLRFGWRCRELRIRLSLAATDDASGGPPAVLGPRRRARASGETTSSAGVEVRVDVRLEAARGAAFFAGARAAVAFLAVGSPGGFLDNVGGGRLRRRRRLRRRSPIFFAARGCAAFLAGAFAGDAAAFLAAVFRAAAFFAGGAAAPAASATTASPSCGSTTEAMFGTAQSMLRRAGAKLATTSVTASPTFITSRALRGGGSDISRSGT